MPTASEYRHEPYGIPCHCYVRRRINRSLSRKSCLRRPQEPQKCLSELARQPKTVTFDPVLRIRSYKSPFRCDDFEKPLPEEPTESSAFKQSVNSTSAKNGEDGVGLVDAASKSSQSHVLSPKTDFNWALCDAITSFFGFQKVSSSLDKVTAASDRQPQCFDKCDSCTENNSKTHVDENNNDHTSPLIIGMDRSRRDEHIYGNHKGCPAGKACKYANRPRERTPPRQSKPKERSRVSRVHETLVGAGGLSRSSTSSWEYGNFAVRKPSSDLTSDSSSHYASRGGSTITSPYQVSNPELIAAVNRANDSSRFALAYETPPTVPSFSTFQFPSTRDDHSGADASVAAQSSQDGDDRTTEKLDEYIYESPDNRNNREYEYVPVKSSLRRRTESENLDSCPVVSVFESVGGGNLYGGPSGGFIKHKTESDLSVETGSPEKGGGHHPRIDVLMTPQSAPDLQAIMSSPYDIKFLNECVKAYVRSAGDSELEIDVLAKIQTIDRTERAPLNHRLGFGGFRGGGGGGGGGRNSPIMDDIFKMTPVALFWTGCAFLIALIYIILFSCAKDHDD